MAAEPLTELEAAIEMVITTFFSFARKEGRKDSLSVSEFKDLATQQLPHLLKVVGAVGLRFGKTVAVGHCVCDVVLLGAVT